jgi:cysteine-rich repeat protein
MGTEQCDDGNATNGDGCSSTCTIECPVGTNFTQDPTTGVCYAYNTTSNNWANARAACVALGGDLAAPSTDSELTFLKAWATIPSSGQGTWIGGTDAAVDGTWTWTDGEAWTYPVAVGVAPWDTVEPNGGTNENCLEFLTIDRFNDLTCTATRTSICEFPNGLAPCGNGSINTIANEECDDGNSTPGDGCSATCTIETGYACSGTPSVCHPIELCWDGIDNDTDGAIDALDTDCAVPAYLPACGAGETLAIYNATALPKTIPDNNATGVSLTFPVQANGSISSVSLLVNITHAWDADVDITLTPPNATALDVSTDNGGSGDNYTNTVFNSSCATAITAGAAPFTGCYRPESTFAGLVGQSAAGTWTLKVADDEAPDIGTLNKAFLVLCMTP